RHAEQGPPNVSAAQPRAVCGASAAAAGLAGVHPGPAPPAGTTPPSKSRKPPGEQRKPGERCRGSPGAPATPPLERLARLWEVGVPGTTKSSRALWLSTTAAPMSPSAVVKPRSIVPPHLGQAFVTDAPFLPPNGSAAQPRAVCGASAAAAGWASLIKYTR